jgi:hypothetical protein
VRDAPLPSGARLLASPLPSAQGDSSPADFKLSFTLARTGVTSRQRGGGQGQWGFGVGLVVSLGGSLEVRGFLVTRMVSSESEGLCPSLRQSLHLHMSVQAILPWKHCHHRGG